MGIYKILLNQILMCKMFNQAFWQSTGQSSEPEVGQSMYTKRVQPGPVDRTVDRAVNRQAERSEIWPLVGRLTAESAAELASNG